MACEVQAFFELRSNDADCSNDINGYWFFIAFQPILQGLCRSFR